MKLSSDGKSRDKLHSDLMKLSSDGKSRDSMDVKNDKNAIPPTLFSMPFLYHPTL